MGIHFIWADDEKTILCHAYDPEWTLEDYYGLVDQHNAVLATIPHIVDLICDFRGTVHLPETILAAFRYDINNTPPNEGLKVVVGATYLTETLIQAVYNTSLIEIPEPLYVKTLEEAMELIERAHKVQKTV
jgi:hypothetical protein